MTLLDLIGPYQGTYEIAYSSSSSVGIRGVDVTWGNSYLHGSHRYPPTFHLDNPIQARHARTPKAANTLVVLAKKRTKLAREGETK